MTTRITEFEGKATMQAILKLEGTLLQIDAQVLEEACERLIRKGRAITINLSGIRFVTDGAAQVLCRLKRSRGVVLEGMHLFVQQVIEMNEADLNNGNKKDGQS